MTTQQQWVDGPFQLIATPKENDSGSHFSVKVAVEMSLAHNILIRGLNAIYLQGPHVKEQKDVEDFAFFCNAWVKTVHHHHSGEENVLFPELEKFTHDENIMNENKEQHHKFLDEMEEFDRYMRESAPTAYKWENVKPKLDAFAEDLVAHLRDEIPTLLDLKKYDSDGIKKVWKKMEDAAKGDIRLPNMFDTILPMVLGCADNKFEGGIHKFPPFPFFMPYLVDYWFANKHRGAWRFCPCDMHGTPKSLDFVQ
ncbi:hypothetical protein DM02DRAFT_619072 [Periconia macrospinosa]|uniref:Hemerythrin-like domain-containing protein n=1 Tax=Periconia macrospinosa TaxID=97972 RepID=A0A2V1D995_9PLEO|nr:hypothetical protein DM02DRAFT_619072 [Periconia macrospinosa]